MGYIVFSLLRPLLTQSRSSLSCQIAAKGADDVLPSVAGHRAVKPSYVNKLELLDSLSVARNSSPSLGKGWVNESDPTGLRRLRWTCL